MTIQNNPKPLPLMPTIAALIVLFVIVATGGLALAQQGQFQPDNSPSRNQGQGGGVLELPTIPGRQGGGPSSTIPPLGPQHGQELTLPSRQLKSQQGYQQVTV